MDRVARAQAGAPARPMEGYRVANRAYLGSCSRGQKHWVGTWLWNGANVSPEARLVHLDWSHTVSLAYLKGQARSGEMFPRKGRMLCQS